MTNPRAWAYSMNAWLNRGSVVGPVVMLDMLSGITT